jgi:hypothetical protein
MTLRVDTLYPPRVDSDGVTWFRPAVRDTSETWGWTSDPTQAHPDYGLTFYRVKDLDHHCRDGEGREGR